MSITSSQAKYWRYFFALIWFAYLIFSSIFLFTKGFLLSKAVTRKVSSCVPLSQYSCNNVPECDHDKVAYVLNNVPLTGNLCMPPKARVVLIIVDALRYDFTLWDESIVDPKPYQNKLPAITELTREFPENTRLFKFIADPPTTTMQRLKALTTGSLPTFIDAGSNFATTEIVEDNFINQVIGNNLSAVFMGDDTWVGLYPNRFLRMYPFPSFNVWDLDTVDNGIRQHLYEELNNSDWSLLIGHFLGVDHCGHRYGPNHAEMARKLNEIDKVIRNVAKQIDDNTMLFVIGDHGMTSTGDHGGESENEITSSLFIYSKKPLYAPNGRFSDTVKQIRIVPTLAAILGIPIPFSNLGMLILPAMPISNNTTDFEWKSLMYDLFSNLEQLVSYVTHHVEHSYMSDEAFDKETVWDRTKEFFSLRHKAAEVKTEKDFLHFVDLAEKFSSSLLQRFENVWTKFDPFMITNGLLIVFMTIFFGYIVTDGIPHLSLSKLFERRYVHFLYLSALFTVIILLVLYSLNIIHNVLTYCLFFTGVISQLLMAIFVIDNWEEICLNWYSSYNKEKLSNHIIRLILVLYLCGLFSNSFILEEFFVLIFLLNTIILVAAFNCLPGKKRNIKTKLKMLFAIYGLMAFIKISTFFWSCREEQQWCFEYSQYMHLITSKTEFTKSRWIITLCCLLAFGLISKEWLRLGQNLMGYSLTITLAKYVPSISAICMSGYWIFNHMSADAQNKLLHPGQNNYLPWTVYFLNTVGLLATLWEPLYIFLRPSESQWSQTSQENAIPHLFKQVKKWFSEDKPPEQVLYVYGLGTVYSAAFVIIGTYCTVLIAMLHGYAMAPSVIIMSLTTMFVLVIISVIRLEKATTIDQLLVVPDKYVLIWALLSQYFFYGTGHQPSFPNINWNAAFVGISEISSQKFIPALLILINTFGSYILLGLMLPLVLIGPFTVYSVLPRTVKSNTHFLANAKGEFTLYQHRELMMTSAFTIGGKYIAFHGLKVFWSMLAATVHCRHLMVWNIFAPKFVFEAIGLFVSSIAVTLSYAILIRINGKLWKFRSNPLDKVHRS